MADPNPRASVSLSYVLPAALHGNRLIMEEPDLLLLLSAAVAQNVSLFGFESIFWPIDTRHCVSL